MQLVKKHGLYRNDKICFVSVEDIIPNPSQPRKNFAPDSLYELAESISRYGILQPLTVRGRNRKFELVAGERRLRAAKLVGLKTVPCILLDVDSEDASLIAIVENLQHKDLDYIEEAVALAELIRTYNMSQEEAARRVGKSQSAVANKLRLLKLPKDILDTLRREGLSERHARALLRLGTNVDRRAVILHIVEQRLTVAKTEEYIDHVITGDEPLDVPEEQYLRNKPLPERSPGSRSQLVLKDLRIFLNTVNRATEMMNQSGINAQCRKAETADSILITIEIPKGHR